MATERSTEILDEMVDLSVDVIAFCKNSDLPRPVVDQVTRSTTSIGANFSEAQDASSRTEDTEQFKEPNRQSLIANALLIANCSSLMSFQERCYT